MTQKRNVIDTAPVYRSAFFIPASQNPDKRTIDVTWTTGARVLRTPWFDDPILRRASRRLYSPYVLARLNDTGPLLDSHVANRLKDQIGSVKRAWVEDGKGYATVQFRSNPESLEIWEDVKSGIIRNISVGYIIHEMTETKGAESSYSTFRATDWEPFEISMVPIPADAGAQTRSSNLSTPTHIRSLSELTTKKKSRPSETQTKSQEASEPSSNQAQLGSEQPAKDEMSANPLKLKADVNFNASDDTRNHPESLANRTFTGSEPAGYNYPESQTASNFAGSESDVKAEAIKTERERSLAIETLCSQAKLPSMTRTLVEAGVSLDEARKRVFEKMIESEPKTVGHISVKAGDYDEISVKRGAMQNALLHRYAPTKS